ncbi:MAG: SusD/RagB family nutrient-binding outer membrane lipoprotein, partial [Rhodothermaceae bacterium]|nr:SusD/RagB family nutrient-binding outer membrane lipoprotein [Rhodothermaceae bacterium]
VTGGTIPRRLRYRENEAVANPDNYNAAIAAQGPDEFTTRVWWDRQVIRVACDLFVARLSIKLNIGKGLRVSGAPFLSLKVQLQIS